MDIKKLPGNVIAFFGFVVLLVGVLNLTNDMWDRAPWFALFCVVSALYSVVRVFCFIAEGDEKWRLESNRNWERGYSAGQRDAK